MAPIRFFLVISAVAAVCGPVPAGAQQLQLQEQRVEGTERICIYRSATRQGEQRVGRGEPCPSFLRRRVAVRQQIPVYATLQRRGYEAGRSVCVYSYQQREYRQPSPSSGYCPYTPAATTPR